MTTFFLVLAVTGIAIQVLLVVLALFEPGPGYRIAETSESPLESPEFAGMLGAVADAEMHPGTHVDVLPNGDNFYEAELAAIRAAQSHVCLEAYIFQRGEIARRFIHALTERAENGVRVRIVLDAVGSFNTWRHTFRELLDAGGEVAWYTPFRWYNLGRYNNRTHREMLIVDSTVGFVGGAGIADHWYKTRGRKTQWRDTMFRVEGRAVSMLQALFAENWVESAGELIAAPKYYPFHETPSAGGETMVIDSTPSYGRSSRARMLYQTLIVSARRSIHLTTPYFLPDPSARRELVRAMVERGVELKIIVPGKHADHLLTRRSSRRLYGELLKNGAQIYEYQPSMIHAKTLVVDGVWSVVGSTNFDYRSFGLNDEVNLAAQDEELAGRIEQNFMMDLAQSRRISYEEWRRRSPFERMHELLGWILERQE